jgi:hypothetical protein
MKKILAYLVLMAMTTLLVGGVVFFLFWLMIGAVTFAVWSLPTAIPSVWFAIRLSLVVGFIVSILFALSKEGSEVVEDFVKDT